MALALFWLGSATASADTQVITYSPFDTTGATAVPVTGAKKRGECFSGSLKIGLASAWRCTAKRGLFDPCYKSPLVRRVVLCVRVPWEGVIKLKVRRFRKHGPARPYEAWALIVGSSGCVLVAGATVDTPYGRSNYVCDNGLFLLGDPLKQQPTWQIWGSYDPRGAGAQLFPITTAYL